MNNTRKVKGLKGILASGLMGAAVGLASLLPATRAEAENVPINSSMSYTSIQDAIDNSNDNDTIIWDSGSYDKFATTNDFWSLKLTREYIFNDVVINGVNADHEYIFKIVEGGNINISGNLTLRESKNGFLVGTAQYDNINITGVTFNVSQYGLSLENIPSTIAPYEKAAVEIENCIINGGDIRIYYDKKGSTPTNYSPYAAAKNNTAIGVGKNVEGYMIFTPKAIIPVTGESINVLGETEVQILGQNEINNNVLIECNALSKQSEYFIYQSPGNNSYALTVTSPYLKENYDSDPNNDIPIAPGAIDSKKNFITDNMKFISETPGASGYLVPQYDSPLNLGNGEYIGAKSPEGVARISEITFGLEAKNPEQTQWKSTSISFDLVGDSKYMFINMEDRWKLDIIYSASFYVDDGDGNPANDVLACDPVTNHIIYTINDPEIYRKGNLYKIPISMFGGPEFEVEHGANIYAKIQNIGALNPVSKTEQFASAYSGLVEVTPEPATLGLLALGGAALLASRKKRKGLEDKVE